jgi:hypothetical protein
VRQSPLIKAIKQKFKALILLEIQKIIRQDKATKENETKKSHSIPFKALLNFIKINTKLI